MRKLNASEKDLYRRNILIPEVGEKGQEKLLNSSVLVVGAGGLGSPALLYLAAAGIGKIGIVDSDRVELSNLQRQVLHGVGDLEAEKVSSAEESLMKIRPDLDLALQLPPGCGQCAGHCFRFRFHHRGHGQLRIKVPPE